MDGLETARPAPGIYKKMTKILQKIARIPKNGTNKFFNYDYVTEADLTDHIRPILAEEGIAFTASVIDTLKTPMEKGEILSTVTMKFCLFDSEDGSFIESVFLGEGTDKGDKGFYKAYTGCVKYFLMKTFLVATGDDPENDEKEYVAKQSSSGQKQSYQSSSKTISDNQINYILKLKSMNRLNDEHMKNLFTMCEIENEKIPDTFNTDTLKNLNLDDARKIIDIMKESSNITKIKTTA